MNLEMIQRINDISRFGAVVCEGPNDLMDLVQMVAVDDNFEFFFWSNRAHAVFAGKRVVQQL